MWWIGVATAVFAGAAPTTAVPDYIIVSGATGRNAGIVNGYYSLALAGGQHVNGQPVWLKMDSPGAPGWGIWRAPGLPGQTPWWWLVGSRARREKNGPGCEGSVACAVATADDPTHEGQSDPFELSIWSVATGPTAIVLGQDGVDTQVLRVRDTRVWPGCRPWPRKLEVGNATGAYAALINRSYTLVDEEINGRAVWCAPDPRAGLAGPGGPAWCLWYYANASRWLLSRYVDGFDGTAPAVLYKAVAEADPAHEVGLWYVSDRTAWLQQHLDVRAVEWPPSGPAPPAAAGGAGAEPPVPAGLVAACVCGGAILSGLVAAICCLAWRRRTGLPSCWCCTRARTRKVPKAASKAVVDDSRRRRLGLPGCCCCRRRAQARQAKAAPKVLVDDAVDSICSAGSIVVLQGAMPSSQARTQSSLGDLLEMKVPVPEYWQNRDARTQFDEWVDLGNDERIQSLLKATWATPAGPPSDSVAPPTGAQLVKAFRVESGELWQRYAEAVARIEDERGGPCTDLDEMLGNAMPSGAQWDAWWLRHSVNEVYAWLGTTPARARSICTVGFRMETSGKKADAPFGRGLYLAECASKADADAADNVPGTHQGDAHEGVCCMLLCRAVLGEPLRVMGGTELSSVSAIEQALESNRYHSVVGDRQESIGADREFVLRDAGQAYPEYVVLYTRQYDVQKMGL